MTDATSAKGQPLDPRRVQPHDIGDEPRRLARLRTNWRAGGDGRLGTVLMLHSLGLDRRAFDRLRLRLDDGWKVVSFDQYAHGSAAGQTDFGWEDLVDAVNAALVACGSGVHLVGHSMGGAIAACAAARAEPGRVATLSVIASPAAAGPAFVQRGADALAHGMATAIDTTLMRWFDGDAEETAIAQARSGLQSMRVAGYAAAWRSFATFDGYRPLAATLPHTLLVAASGDLSTPPVAMTRIADDFAAAGASDRVRMEVVEGHGHMLPLTAPDTVASLLMGHWHAHPPIHEQEMSR
jgi:3-oxoadipate enol-lactonase